MNTIKFTITPFLFNSLFIVSLICLFNFNSIGQNKLEWFVEGSLRQVNITGGKAYTFKPGAINNANYDSGTDPFVWGYVVHQDDTFDFEILCSKLVMNGNGPMQVSIYDKDQSLDFQSQFKSAGLGQHVELQFNIFEYQSRENTPFLSGQGGTPSNLEIGISRPNQNPTGIGVLHAAELYYIENLNSSSSPNYTINDPCSQIDVSKADDPLDPIEINSDPIDASWLNNQQNLGRYPYDLTSRTYFHTKMVHNTCDTKNDNLLQLTEAEFKVFFQPMSSFVIGRRDIKKTNSNYTGYASSIGLVAKDELLPIELSHFSAQWNNNEVLLYWETSTEINNAYFQVERSADGINWEVIDEIAGAGNSTQLLSYQTVDYSPMTGSNYYRLKQVDYDEQFSYSSIVVLENKNTTQHIEVYPNPTSSLLNIKGVNVRSQIQIFNHTGQMMLQQDLQQGLSIDLSSLPTGLYWLTIRDARRDYDQTIKLVKK